jgi:hypothetical protein
MSQYLGPNGEVGPLRQLLEAQGCSLKALTVLAPQNDPFRVDTPSGHRDGAWLAEQASGKLPDGQVIHLRGFHYAVIGETKPDGKPYTNTDTDWKWLQGTAAKCARFLGYVLFDQIRDARNSEPVMQLHEHIEPLPYLLPGEVELRLPDELTPKIRIEGFVGVQPYKLVLVGEKTSLEPVLAPVAEEYEADLYLPTGEISDTLAYRMARVGAEDGRPMVVFYFADCDPAGWQMPVSLSRKLQAFRALQFPELEWEMRPVALTPDHVREYGLPSTPLKPTEKRADKWFEAMGVEQTEVDALATLQPEVLDQLARDALDPFYDHTLDARVKEARMDWLALAQDGLEDQLGPDRLAEMRAEAELQLGGLEEQVDAVNAALRVDASGITVPPIEIPRPEVPEPDDGPLVSSRDGFADQCEALIARKEYR